MSTAAHQVEGDNSNQWSDWELAGRIKSGDSCGKACDWWENAERDFDIARDMGMKALRLSLEWSRIEPEEGRFDPAALHRYRQMLEGLHQRGIEPIVCLHHFTHPRWFEQRGAFLKADAPQLFERFTREVVNAVGDLCRFWVTFNEPNVYAACGYVLGEFPPGHKGQLLNALRVNRMQARAHVLAYRAIHELVPEAQVGWAQHYVVFEAVPGMANRWVASLLDRLFNHTFFDLIETGRLGFPFGLLNGRDDEVKGCCDFVGLNVYGRFHVAFDLRSAKTFFANVFVPAHVPQGDAGVDRPYGEAYPQAISEAVKRAARFGEADLHHGKRRARCRRPDSSLADRKCLARVARADRAGLRHSRLSALDADRQFRVERRLEAALRVGRARSRKPNTGRCAAARNCSARLSAATGWQFQSPTHAFRSQPPYPSWI